MAGEQESTEAQPKKRTRAKSGTKAAADSLGPLLKDMRLITSMLLRESGKNDDNRREMERLIAEGFAQVRVRQERHHKEQCKKLDGLTTAVEGLTKAVEDKVLQSDVYTVQAIEVLGRFRADFAELCRTLGVQLHVQLVTSEPVPANDAPAPLVLYREAAAAA
jgi:uncharacterized protein (DUF2342 family)